jgi:hypothetical protein
VPRTHIRPPSPTLHCPTAAYSIAEDDALAVLKQHILDETVEAASGIQFLLGCLREQWAVAWETQHVGDPSVRPYHAPSINQQHGCEIVAGGSLYRSG